MVTHKIRTISDVIRRGYWLKVRCLGCGHTAELEPISLRFALGASVHLDDMGKHLRCSRCQRKRIAAEPCYPPE